MPLSDEHKGMVVAYHQCGMSQRKIVRTIRANGQSITQRGVSKILAKFLNTGTVSRKVGSGRKRSTTVRDDRQLLRSAISNRKQTLTSLSTSFYTADGHRLSKQTISRRLNERGFRFCRCRRVPMLTNRHRKQRLQWAKEYQHKPLAFWDTVLWSDESRFCLHSDRPAMCIRKKGEEFSAECTSKTVKFSDGITVWSCFSSSGTGSLYCLPRSETINAGKYQQILHDHLLPAIARLHLDGNYVFMHDNAPCHRAKSTSEWLAANNITVMAQWPPQSTDCNPLENLWDYCSRKLQEVHHSNRNELWLNLQNIWSNIPPEFLIKLVHSVPRRLQEVIKNKGNNTHY